MMECIPREIRGSQFLQDIFFIVQNARIQGILGDGRRIHMWRSVFDLRKWGSRRDIVNGVRWIIGHKKNFNTLQMISHSLRD
jgi:hypothetical protein